MNLPHEIFILEKRTENKSRASWKIRMRVFIINICILKRQNPIFFCNFWAISSKCLLGLYIVCTVLMIEPTRAMTRPRFVQVNSSFCKNISYYPNIQNHQDEKINWKEIQVQAMWQNFSESQPFRWSCEFRPPQKDFSLPYLRRNIQSQNQSWTTYEEKTSRC